MEQRDEKNLGKLINLLTSTFGEVRIIQQGATEALSLLRVDNQGRNYSFYLLQGDTVIVGFDNSEDRRAQILKYGKRGWKKHFSERVPHQHTFGRQQIQLTEEMTIADFILWLKDGLDTYLAGFPAAMI